MKKLIDKIEVFSMLCKAYNKWGIYIKLHYPEDEKMEHRKAVPWVNWKESLQAWTEEEGIALFDTEEEMDKCYDSTVGEDGPTKFNKYNGRTRAYALTCGPDGILLTENT